MAIYDRHGKSLEPYSFSVEPYYNGSPLRKGNVLVLSPRFTNTTTADNWFWNSSGDYDPAGCYADLSLEYTAMSDWYTTLSGHGGTSNQLNHPGSTGNFVTGARPFYKRQDDSNVYRFSLWMSIGVGGSPHPGFGASETYMAFACNANGDHQGGSFWNAPGNVADYTNPRRWFDGSEKIRVSGQRYGTTNYRDWVCIANQQPASYKMRDINATTLRVFNIGRNANSDLTIYGLKVVYHIYPGPSSNYGNLEM